MKTIYLVFYKVGGYIEGFVKDKDEFEEWIGNRNIKRIEEGEVLESIDEFTLVEVNRLSK